MRLFPPREGRRLWGRDDLNLTEANLPAVTLSHIESSLLQISLPSQFLQAALLLNGPPQFQYQNEK